MQCGHRAWTVPRSRQEKAKPARFAVATSGLSKPGKMCKWEDKNTTNMRSRGVVAHTEQRKPSRRRTKYPKAVFLPEAAELCSPWLPCRG